MSGAISQFLAFSLAFLLVMALVPPAVKLAVRHGFTDKPGGRKAHDRPVPPIGGIILFPVYMTVALFSGLDLAEVWPVYAALVLILVMGAIDDYGHVDAWVKFGVQFLCAGLIVMTGDARLYQLGDLFGFGGVGLDFMSIPFSILAIMLLINAINLMDGMDGLAGGMSFVILFWLMVAGTVAGIGGALPIMPLMGALVGFLFYNMRHPLGSRRARIFLGDAGSMGLGLVIAWFCIALAQKQNSPIILPISVAWVVALPVIDACAQFYRRIREGRHPFSPDRGHFHHHFIEAGVEPGRATPIILLTGFIFGGIGYLGIEAGLPQCVLTLGWIALLVGHIALSQKPRVYIGLFRRLT